MSAEYPTKVTTQLYYVAARLKTTLTDDIVQGVATIPVASTSGFPDKGFITIENETKQYTGKTALTFTGCSNINGTDVAHSNGAEVRCAISSETINRIIDEIIATQTALGITGAFNFVGKTGNETVAGVKTFSSTPKTDALAEKTAATGVTIDGVLIKDDLDTSGIVGKTTVQTLTNKRITKRVGSIASTASLTIDIDSYDVYKVTALAEAITINAPSGTPTDQQGLIVRIKDNGTARAINWNAAFASLTATLPTTTVLGKTLITGFMYSSVSTKYECIYAESEA